MSGSLTDALSAAGLLLAALALVYSTWTASIDKAITDAISTEEGQKKEDQDKVRSIRNWRAAPMAAASWLITLVFLPRDIQLLCTSVTALASGKGQYDDVAAVFLVSQMLFIGLAIYVSNQVSKLNAKLD